MNKKNLVILTCIKTFLLFQTTYSMNKLFKGTFKSNKTSEEFSRDSSEGSQEFKDSSGNESPKKVSFKFSETFKKSNKVSDDIFRDSSDSSQEFKESHSKESPKKESPRNLFFKFSEGVSRSPRTLLKSPKNSVDKATRKTSKSVGTSPRWAQSGCREIQEIVEAGSVNIDGLSVKDSISVIGSLRAYNSTIGLLNVKGNVFLSNCYIKDPSAISGKTKIIGSTLFKTLTITSSYVISIDSSLLTEVHIYYTGEDEEMAIVQLKNNTTIYGSITFHGCDGRILLDNSSQIKGNIIGGTIVYS